jgi:uncharacterized membrane protein YczE
LLLAPRASRVSCPPGARPAGRAETGLNSRTGLSLRLVRRGIEVTVLAVGFLLGGTVGLGTVAFAMAIRTRRPVRGRAPVDARVARDQRAESGEG